MRVRTGLDLLERRWPRDLIGARVGLLAHPASVDFSLRHAADLFLRSKKLKLAAIFGPQHGYLGNTQDNMIEWEGYRDRATGLPVYSLYGEHRKPTPTMLKGLEAIAIDMQDVGARYYTFIWTMDLVMEAAREQGIPVIVLDRPNPIGGIFLEGPVLKPEWQSFVGLRPLPIRHGMSIGEISHYLAAEYHTGLDLRIIRMEGWKREMWFDGTGLPWVIPSPNMPTLDTAIVYPGMCLLEGTLLSEGRGTTRPFELFGAPFIEPDKLVARLGELRLPGMKFRPVYFQPTFQKHAGRLCGGAQIHVTDREKFLSFATAVAILIAIRELYPDDFSWKAPPYEYEHEEKPIDILAGTDRLRLEIEAGVPIRDMIAWWRRESAAFRRRYMEAHRLY